MEFSTPESVYHIAVETEIELTEWLNVIERASELYYQEPSTLPSSAARPKRTKGNLLNSLSSLHTKKSTTDIPTFTRADIPQQTPEPTPSETSNEPAGNPRDAIIKEILYTERDYVKDLEILIQEYLKPLESYGILKKDFKDAIFANVEDLFPIHQEFLAQLEIEFEKEDPLFSRVFIEVVCILYTFYYFLSNFIIGSKMEWIF